MAVLHKEFYKNTGEGQKNIPVNQDIRRYIDQIPDRNFSSILAKDDRWQVFYHLSELRTSVLNWYEWREAASLLEIGGEFGALTGLFCEHCRKVTTVEYGLFKAEAIVQRYKDKGNLHVYAGGLNDIQFSEKFDYVVMIGSLERQCNGSTLPHVYEDYLKHIKTLLKPDGRILVAVENRYGLRYFCGEAEPYTGKPFAGINRYPDKSKGYTFDRQELKNILFGAGYKHIKFYYPLPDYKLAQMIYSDEYLPQKDLGERLLFYHVNQDTLLAPEQRLYADLIDNQVFPFFANSFLVECTVGEETGTTVFAAVTTDRGKEHGLVTSVHKVGYGKNNKIVKKQAIYQEGRDSIRLVYKNMLKLNQRGIEIVPHTLDSGTLVMPFVPEITCSDYLRRLALNKNREQFEYIFELIYQNILKSSEILEDNGIISEPEGIADNCGPILKHCYVDMVPFNCFFVKGQLLYFDQEFVKNNYPALYPMYRAIMYTYAFIPEAEHLVPLDVMKERYGLGKLWDVFRKVEDRFVASNRRYDIYQNFYKWTGIRFEHMRQNAEMLCQNVQMNQINKEILTENERYLAEFRHYFSQFSNKRIILYGKGPRTKLIIEGALEFQIIGLMDKTETEGCFYGKPILTYEKALEENVDIIIVVSKPHIMPFIYHRISDFCKNNHILLYGERGEELFSFFGDSQNIIEDDPYFKVNAQTLWKQIEMHDVISFAVDDTLLMFNTFLEQDIEAIIRDRCKSADNYKQQSDQIRSSLLVQRQTMVDIFRKCLKENKVVYLVTDINIKRDIMVQKLCSCGITGYAGLFIGQEQGRTRKNRLFDLLEEMIGERSWLHIGASRYADEQPLRNKKADIFLVKSALDMLSISSYAKIRTVLHNINERSMIGIFIAKVFNDPFALYHSGGRPVISDIYQIAYLFVAPLITNFIFWVSEKLEQENYDDILFASRDGYLIQKLYEMYREHSKAQLPEGKYFLTSRRAASNAGMFNEDDIRRIFSLPYEDKPEEVLKDKFYLNEQDIPKYDPDKFSSLLEYALYNQNIIYQNSLLQRNGYRKYMNAIGLERDKTYAFFDLATSGTTQLYLSRFAPFVLKGLSLLLYDVGDADKQSLEIQALYNHSDSSKSQFEEYFRWNYAFLEPMLTAPETSLYSFSCDGTPKFGPENRTEDEKLLRAIAQSAILDYFEAYHRGLYISDIRINKDIAGQLYQYKDQAFTKECCSMLDYYISRDDLGAGVFNIKRC